eukprot:TRINITY_DN35398_c0_g1_i1.p1 TRINITY_DN35398_c0_g1~~TRINITY_DN35398_c0_g1_i1.p1  ORF type:complete len:363 (-),score=49.27 TRINITY_DN35398_c0_g1_i1:94-1128(-)
MEATPMEIDAATGRTFMPGDAAEDDGLLLFGVPKKGRLKDDVMAILKAIGLDAKRPDRLDVAVCKEHPIKLVFLPSADIAKYVLDGHVDLGITGSDIYEETVVGSSNATVARKLLKPLMQLGVAKCRLCLLAPSGSATQDPKDFVGKRIATTFPESARHYFDGLERETGCRPGSTKIRTISGSVEAACMLGLADAIIIPVDTGLTYQAAGLGIISEIHSSQGVLFQRLPGEMGPGEEPLPPTGRAVSKRNEELVSMILRRVQGFYASTRYVHISYKCSPEALASCLKRTPGKKSPTISELVGGYAGWSAISALVSADEMHAVMDDLKSLGAEDIISFQMKNARC